MVSGSEFFENDPRVVFWRDEVGYYQDTSDYYFLPRAVELFGREYYGNDWTGQEAATPWNPPLPDDPADWNSCDLIYGQCLLMRHHPFYRDQVRENPDFLPEMTVAERLEAAEISRVLDEETRDAFHRFKLVADALLRLFKCGAVATGVRAELGGDISRIRPYAWQDASEAQYRFNRCRMYRTDSITGGVISNDALLIFVDRREFLYALEYLREFRRRPKSETLAPDQQAAEAPPSAEFTRVDYLSPYLRCMIDATRELGITATDDRKKDELIHALPKYWPGAPEALTQADKDRMATFLREPEYKRGRGRGSGSQSS